jgi:hypothetical protein
MSTANALGDLLSTLLLRRPFKRGGSKKGSISKLCLSLLSEVTEVSGLQLAGVILEKYHELDERTPGLLFLSKQRPRYRS